MLWVSFAAISTHKPVCGEKVILKMLISPRRYSETRQSSAGRRSIIGRLVRGLRLGVANTTPLIPTIAWLPANWRPAGMRGSVLLRR
jgi:hypothetical protein